MSHNSGGFPKLKGRENYENWKFSAKAFLEVEGIWDIVVGVETEQDVGKRAILNRNARARIVLMVEPVNFSHIQDETSAQGVWEKLEKAFADTGLMRRVGLLRVLITTKLEQCDSMEDFVNRIISTANKLSGAGMKLNDEWIGTLLLAGLSTRFEPMIMAIQSSGVKISSDHVKTQLLNDTSAANNGNGHGETSMYTNTRRAHTQHTKHDSQHHQNHKQQRNKVKCYNCGKDGNFSRDCRAPRGGSASKFRGGGGSSGGHGRTETNWSCTTGTCEPNAWYIDAGSTAHMSKSTNLVVEKQPAASESVTVANSSALKVEGVGVVNLSTPLSNVKIEKVLVVPEICAKLLSVSSMVRKGMRLVFDSRGCSIENEKTGKQMATASEVDGLYRLNASSSNAPNAFFAHGESAVATLWHRRLAHIGVDALNRMKGEKAMEDIGKLVPSCEICVLGKHARNPFVESTSKSKAVLELIHSDVCGPMRVPSLQGSRYFVTFIDDFSRRVVVVAMEKKSMVLDIFKEFQLKMENQMGKKLKVLRSDNGLEYCNSAMNNYLKSAGIVHQTTVPYTPQQNGVAERMNRTLVEKARCMLFDAGLSTKFWADAIVAAAHITNCIPRKSCNKGPEEMWSDKKPNLSRLKVFGCRAWRSYLKRSAGNSRPSPGVVFSPDNAPLRRRTGCTIWRPRRRL